MTTKELLFYLNSRCNKGLDFVEELRENLPNYTTLRAHILETASYQSACCDILFDMIYS